MGSKVAIVTGAKQGLGLGIARRFARDGFGVVLDDLQDASAEAEAIRREGGDAIAVVADVGDPAAVDALFSATLKAFGRVDALVNNAVLFDAGTVVEHDSQMWDRIMATDLKGPFLCSRAAVVAMRRSGGGVILNLGSEYGIKGGPARAIYATAKAGLHHLTKLMAVDHAVDKVRVNCLIPGPVMTPLMATFARQSADPKGAVAGEENSTLLKRLGTVEEIASVASFLVSDGASFMTGALVTVDGGVTAI